MGEEASAGVETAPRCHTKIRTETLPFSSVQFGLTIYPEKIEREIFLFLFYIDFYRLPLYSEACEYVYCSYLLIIILICSSLSCCTLLCRSVSMKTEIKVKQLLMLLV